jgi:hypothetical protein
MTECEIEFFKSCIIWSSTAKKYVCPLCKDKAILWDGQGLDAVVRTYCAACWLCISVDVGPGGPVVDRHRQEEFLNSVKTYPMPDS